MWMFPKDPLISLSNLERHITGGIELSRFRASVTQDTLRNKWGIKIMTVRLRNKKDYCGSHPGPCLVTGRRHSVTSYLEGLDWVGFNALLNDTLDKMWGTCDIFSFNTESRDGGKYYIRRGNMRRVYYPYTFDGQFNHWVNGDVSAFANYCGKAPPPHDVQVITDGTPGYPCYTLEEEAEYAKEQEPEEKTKPRRRARVLRSSSPVLVSLS